MARRKTAPKPIVTLSTQTGDIALAMIPGQCYLANNGRDQGLGAPKVTAKDVRGTLGEDHELVVSGVYEAGTRFIAPTPPEMAYYIGNVEKSYSAGEVMVATEDASFDLDLSAPGVKIIPPHQVGPKGGVRGDRSEETKRSQAQPQRAEQMRTAGQRYEIRQANARRLRVGKKAMTQEEIELHLISLGL